tara:strand:- start:626 stop:775 length:150 start_codon:yes stop_codon:yes gene_type:complete
MIQVFALLTVMSGLYYGYTESNMDYELRMFMYGAAMFYAAHWVNERYIK